MPLRRVHVAETLSQDLRACQADSIRTPFSVFRPPTAVARRLKAAATRAPPVDLVEIVGADLIVPRPVEDTGADASLPTASESATPVSSSSVSPVRAGGLSWAALLQRVVAFDILHCPRCGGRRRIIAVHTRAENHRPASQAPGGSHRAGGPSIIARSAARPRGDLSGTLRCSLALTSPGLRPPLPPFGLRSWAKGACPSRSATGRASRHSWAATTRRSPAGRAAPSEVL